MTGQACVICLWLSLTITLSVSPLGCPPGEYREPETDTCKSCLALCEKADTLGAVKLCSQHCPEYKSSLCPSGTYFDPAVSRCDSCSSVCDQHNQRGTTDDCKKYCPKEYKSSLCPSGTYYDPAVSRCDSCSSVCDQHNQRGTTDDCKTYCPKEFDKSSNNDKPEEGKNQGAIIAGSVVGVAIVITAVVGVIWVILCRERTPTDRTPPFPAEYPNRATVNYVQVACPVHTQCVDMCTISQSSSAEALQAEEAEDGFHAVHVEKPNVPMAYADLPVRSGSDHHN